MQKRRVKYGWIQINRSSRWWKRTWTLGEEIEMALDDASTQDMIDLAGIIKLHDMVTQDQFHHAHGARTCHLETQLDEEVGWEKQPQH